MNPSPQHHPQRDELEAFAEGRLEAAQAQAIEHHLAACAACLDAVKHDQLLAGAVTRPPESAANTPDNLSAGSSPPTTSFDQVDSLCRIFREQWESAVRPKIREFLDQTSPDSRRTMLRNLLFIEIECRRARGEQPRAEEYAEAFPQFAPVIREAFYESTASSLDGSPAGQARAPKTTPAPFSSSTAPAARRLGDYQLVRELGRGGMGMVYEATHVQHGHRVALKILPTVDGAKLHHFKREFRAAADINHPHLIGLHTLESDGAQWFFTMDLIEGIDFFSYVRPRGKLDPSLLRVALSQLVAGVMALHGNHIIHRDLKPSNVMVTHQGHLIVLDFGLVLELDHASLLQSSMNIMGTPDYMAPEQGLGRAAAASDWYSVGVMLYEALAGKRPFTGPVLQMLQDKQQRDPPPLPEDPALPGDLAELCMKLLVREPERRPDAFEIAKAISSPQTTAATVKTDAGEHLVGRDVQLQILEEAYANLQETLEPVVVSISGRSGEGKTTLAEHFLAPLRKDQRVTVLSGRCYDRESVPFKALDSLIDALVSHLRSLRDRDLALLIPRDIAMLAHVFPVLQRVEVIAEAPQAKVTGLDEQQVRNRAFAAFRELLQRISDRMPIMLFIDDLQWGDADSAAVLFEVLRPPEAPGVLFLGSYRSDEAQTSPFLQHWRELQRKNDVAFRHYDIKVGPLSLENCTALVVSLVGKDTDVVRRRAMEFYQETGGNPYFLIELVGCFDPDSDSFQPMPIHEVIAKKLENLPEGAGRLLDVVAVSGHALAVEEAYQTAGFDVSALATLTHMRNERLVRLVGAEENPLVDTYHDKIRENVLGHMKEDASKAIHRRLGETIEQQLGEASKETLASLESELARPADEQQVIPRAYDLAYHFDAGGDHGKALRYALLAARQARRQFAPEVAAEQYAIAKRNAQQSSPAVRYRIAEGYGEALMLLGRYEEASKQLDGVTDLTEDAMEKARVEALLGELAFKQGGLSESIAHFESALRRMGVKIPHTAFGLTWGLIRESIIQCWHSLLPGRLHKKQTNREIELVLRLFSRLFYPLAFRSTPKWVWSSFAGLNLAEQFAPSSALADNLAVHGMLMPALGWHSRAARYLDRSLEMRRQFNDVRGQGHSLLWKGVGFWASGRYDDGVASLAKAIENFDKTGDMSELNFARFHLSCCHYSAGNLAEAVAQAYKTFELSVRIGDPRANCSLYLWSKAMGGNLPFAELKSCFAINLDDILSTCNLDKGEGYWHLFEGRTQEAVEAFQRACDRPLKHRVLLYHTVAGAPALVKALRLRAEALESEDPAQARKLRKRALRLARRAAWLSWFFPIERALSLRELSLLYAAKGKTKKALRFAQKSCDVAKQQKAKYELAQSALVRARLRHKIGNSDAGKEIEKAEAELREFEKMMSSASSASDVTTLG